MAIVSLPYNWNPRPDQLNLWNYLLNGGTRAVEVAHRRWGKDDVALHATAVATQRRIGNYWHMLPEYGQARKAIWEAINPKTGKRRIDEAFPPAIRSQTKTQEMLIKLKSGSTWQLVGSDNYDSLVGSPPIGVVFSEYALANPMAWGYIRPILLENSGWALFIYTSRGDNHGKTQYMMAKSEPSWFAEMVKADQSPVFTHDQLQQERREMIAEYGPDEGEALFLQEYFCSWEGALPGSYYGKDILRAESEGRVCFVPYILGNEVYTFWDLGIDDSTTIWMAQFIGNEIRFIDYYENTGRGLDHYSKVLRDKPYVFGDHYFPHDAASKSIQTGKSTRAYAEDLGIRPVIIVPRAKDTQAVLAGIQAGRKVFNQCFFDRTNCAQGLSALRNYRSEYDPKNKKPGNYPVHDWACLTGETKILTRDGTRQIMDLPKTGEVFTLCGWKRYTNPTVTQKGARLVEVQFTDGFTVNCTPDHLFLTANGWKYAVHLDPTTPILSSLTQSPNTSTVDSTDSTPANAISPEAASNFTELCGPWLSARCPTGATSITATEILEIIPWVIWSAALKETTWWRLGRQPNTHELTVLLTQLVQRLLSGADLPKADSGIADTPKEPKAGLSGNARIASVLIPLAARCSALLSERVVTLRGIAPRGVNLLTIEGVKALSRRDDVWCITVPDTHTYSLENGCITHNSHGADAFRTFAVGYKPKVLQRSVRSVMQEVSPSVQGVWL